MVSTLAQDLIVVTLNTHTGRDAAVKTIKGRRIRFDLSAEISQGDGSS